MMNLEALLKQKIFHIPVVYTGDYLTSLTSVLEEYIRVVKQYDNKDIQINNFSDVLYRIINVKDGILNSENSYWDSFWGKTDIFFNNLSHYKFDINSDKCFYDFTNADTTNNEICDNSL